MAMENHFSASVGHNLETELHLIVTKRGALLSKQMTSKIVMYLKNIMCKSKKPGWNIGHSHNQQIGLGASKTYCRNFNRPILKSVNMKNLISCTVGNSI